MAITDINISETLDVGAPSIKYTGNMDPNKEPNMQVASDPSWEAEWEDAYQNYKIKQIELGQEFVSKEEFMEDYQNNMATGGRAHLGLGSFIKKIGKAAKSVVKSPLGKAAILGMAGWGIPGTSFKGLIGGGGGGLGSFFGKGSFSPFKAMIGQGTADVGLGPSGLGKFLGGKFVNQATGALTGLGWGAGAVGLGMGAQMFENMQPDEIKALRNNPEALRSYLKQYHTNTNPEKSEKEVDLWVEQNMYSTGGRVGFDSGSDNKPNGWFKTKIKEKIKPYTKEGRGDYKKEWLHSKGLDMTVEEWDDKPLKEKLKIWFREGNAQGGRTGFAFGPDQTAQAAGIMGQLPVRDNAAGVKELDLRDSGGFVPPVGIKEKADDIPAMLSNNEFVMTADAVRAAGGGSVEKGAQVMYDQMKNLENRIA